MFVDIHNHILPGIDDGADTLEDALEMARQAIAAGTDILVATPHRAWMSRRDAPPDWVREHVTRFQAALNEAQIPLTIVPGVEMALGPRLAADLTAGRTLTLGGSSVWALVEPPFDSIPHDALDNLHAIRTAGFEIVLAHPERNRLVQKNLAFVRACADLGIAFQLTTGSLLGRFGSGAQQAAEAILAHAAEWRLVIASDAHDLFVRSPGLMAAARDRAAELVGLDRAQAMVDSHPRTMVSPL